MDIKGINKIESEAKEVWIVSPYLYYDVNDPEYQTVVHKNLDQNIKYRYIVPNNDNIRDNIETFKTRFGKSEADINEMFLLLPESEFGPFMNEMAIYNPNTKKCLCGMAPKKDCHHSQEILTFDEENSSRYAEHFKNLWKKYKRSNP